MNGLRQVGRGFGRPGVAFATQLRSVHDLATKLLVVVVASPAYLLFRAGVREGSRFWLPRLVASQLEWNCKCASGCRQWPRQRLLKACLIV